MPANTNMVKRHGWNEAVKLEKARQPTIASLKALRLAFMLNARG